MKKNDLKQELPTEMDSLFPQQRWKDVSWNGIHFETPADWEVVKIGTAYLLMEDESGPVMEIKWGPVKGKFSLQKQLEKITDQSRKEKGLAVSGCPLPVAWENALGSFHVACFNWTSGATIGKGVILHCRRCGKAAMVQFLKRVSTTKDSGLSGETCLRLLTSFRDHAEEKHSTWKIYDIEAALPEPYQLAQYRFEAGEFELHFKNGRESVSLYRWGVASLLLQGQNLETLAPKKFPWLSGEPLSILQQGERAFEWRTSAESWQSRLRHRVRSYPRFQLFRAWHLVAKDRIMAVRAAGKRPIDPVIFNQICCEYGVV